MDFWYFCKNLYASAMTKHYLAVDLGATSGRVILASVEAKKVQMTTLHRFPTPLQEEQGRYYWDIFKLHEEIVAGLQKAAGYPVESIGIDTWGVDFCRVKPDGTLCRPRAYRDPYTKGVPEAFFRTMPKEELYRRTGIQIMNFNSVFQLYAQQQAGDMDGIDKVLFIPDALGYLLTGRMVCEYTILSTSAVMNPRTKEIDADIMQACGLRPSLFAPLVLPGTTLGVLKPEIAEKTGLGPVKVVAVAGHDTGSAVAAVPATSPHFAYLSSGTWSLMGIETPEPVIDERMFALNFTNEGGASGNIRLLKNITGMWLLEQCLAAWRAQGRNYSYDEVHAMARACEPSAQLIDPDDPDFAAPTDMPRAIADACRKAGFPAPETDAQTVRLIYDSLAAKYAAVFHKLEEIAGGPLDTLHIIGGGSQNTLLNQMTADACGVRVVAGPAEGTALGNVMVQAGLGRGDILASIETRIYEPQGNK